MSAVKISVERLLEQEVDEISRSGEEKYIKPFTFSEQLTHFAGKIDFHEGDEIQPSDKDEETDETEKINNDDLKQNNQWPWEAVHTKLRIALSEVCVMLDVLQSLNKKKYLVLDPITQNPEPNKQTVQMLDKRKLLARAGAIIAKGASSLSTKKDKSEPIIVEESDNEYFMQLMQLRQYWRVKKTGHQIIGDLSYRTAGSNFWHQGLFEVKPDHDNVNGSGKTLSVNISPDLTQKSDIVVEVIDKNNLCPSHIYSTCTTPNFNIESMCDWKHTLKMAQQHLFNKEIFSRLSNDAFQESFAGVEVLNSKITCKVLDDAEVIISHKVGECSSDKPFSINNDCETANDLKLILSNLLQRYHKKNSKWYTPYPSTSNYYQKQVRSSSYNNLLNRKAMPKQNSMLKDFLDEVKHKIWLSRAKSFLDAKVKSIYDPSLMFHWNVLSSRLQSSVMIYIITKANTEPVKTTFLLSLDVQGFHLRFDDATYIDLLFDIKSLDLIIESKISNHLLNVAKQLSIHHDWYVTQSNLKFLTLNEDVEQFPNNGIIVSSPKNTKRIQLCINNMKNISVQVSTTSADEEKSDLFDEEFQYLNKLRTIHWDFIPGATFVEKFEILLLAE